MNGIQMFNAIMFEFEDYSGNKARASEMVNLVAKRNNVAPRTVADDVAVLISQGWFRVEEEYIDAELVKWLYVTEQARSAEGRL